MKILIVGPSWVGDSVISQSLFKVIKSNNKDSKIEVLAPEWTKDIFDSILKQKMQLWISWNGKTNVVESAIVTEIVDYPRLRSCRYFLAGGTNMKVWFNPMKEQIEQWALKNNCQRIELVGRKGWVKWLKDYKQKHIILMKELKNE